MHARRARGREKGVPLYWAGGSVVLGWRFHCSGLEVPLEWMVDIMDESESSLSEEVDGCVTLTGVQEKKNKRFTAAQQACLMKYWSNGQIGGCGRRFSLHIANAAKDTGLSYDQVKVSK